MKSDGVFELLACPAGALPCPLSEQAAKSFVVGYSGQWMQCK